MSKYKIPNDIDSEAHKYMEGVLAKLEEKGIMEEGYCFSLYIAINISLFTKASRQVEKDGMMISICIDQLGVRSLKQFLLNPISHSLELHWPIRS